MKSLNVIYRVTASSTPIIHYDWRSLYLAKHSKNGVQSEGMSEQVLRIMQRVVFVSLLVRTFDLGTKDAEIDSRPEQKNKFKLWKKIMLNNCCLLIFVKIEHLPVNIAIHSLKLLIPTISLDLVAFTGPWNLRISHTRPSSNDFISQPFCLPIK